MRKREIQAKLESACAAQGMHERAQDDLLRRVGLLENALLTNEQGIARVDFGARQRDLFMEECDGLCGV